MLLLLQLFALVAGLTLLSSVVAHLDVSSFVVAVVSAVAAVVVAVVAVVAAAVVVAAVVAVVILAVVAVTGAIIDAGYRQRPITFETGIHRFLYLCDHQFDINKRHGVLRDALRIQCFYYEVI